MTLIAFEEAHPWLFEPRRRFFPIVALRPFSYGLVGIAALAGFVALSAEKGALGGYIIFGACACIWAVTFVQPPVVVGGDGIVFGPVYNRRFVAYSQLLSVTQGVSGVEIVLKEATVVLRTGGLRSELRMLTTIIDRRAESARLGSDIAGVSAQAPYRGDDGVARLITALRAPTPCQRENAIGTLAKRYGHENGMAVALLRLSRAAADPQLRRLLAQGALACNGGMEVGLE